MKQIFILIRVIAAIVLITLGVDNLNEPSNFLVGVGIAEIILGLAVVYGPIKSLFNKI
jgi:small-conductance mechanosensitive channel